MYFNNKGNVWTGRFTSAGAVCSSVSMWVTLKGLLHTSGELSLAVPLTVASGIIAFLLFAFLCRAMPSQSAEVQGKLAMGVAVPGLAVVVATSTLMGILGMAAPEAQRLDMLRTVDLAEARLDEQLKQLKRQSEAVGIVESSAKGLVGVATREKEKGDLERRGESGKAYQDLIAISEAYEAAAEVLRADQKRREEAGQAATEALSKLRELTESTQANVESLRRISEPATQHLRVLSVSLAELERSALEGDVLAPVEAALAQQELIPGRNQGKTSEGSQERQQAAAGVVAQLGSQSHQQTVERLDLLRVEPRPHARFTLLSPADAVLEHLWSVAHLVAFPVALDIGFPLVALIALSLIQAPPRNGRGFNPSEQGHETSEPWPQLDRRVAAFREQRSLGHGRGGQSGPN
jgi:hypothetical protein